MISSTRLEEFIAKIQAYSDLKATATLVVDKDGSRQISAGIVLMGYPFSLDEAAKILVALPRAVERAGALTAKLDLDSKMQESKQEPAYEPPVVTPVGNMKDLMAEVCTAPHEHDHEVDTVKVTLLPVVPSSLRPSTTCKACTYSGIEPNDMDLACGHPDAGTFGVSLRREPAAHCPDRVKFEQHPGRNPDGSLKSTVIPGI